MPIKLKLESFKMKKDNQKTDSDVLGKIKCKITKVIPAISYQLVIHIVYKKPPTYTRRIKF